MTKQQLLKYLDQQQSLRRHHQSLYQTLQQFIQQDKLINPINIKQAGVSQKLINRYRLLILDFSKLQYNLYY